MEKGCANKSQSQRSNPVGGKIVGLPAGAGKYLRFRVVETPSLRERRKNKASAQTNSREKRLKHVSHSKTKDEKKYLDVEEFLAKTS